VAGGGCRAGCWIGVGLEVEGYWALISTNSFLGLGWEVGLSWLQTPGERVGLGCWIDVGLGGSRVLSWE